VPVPVPVPVHVPVVSISASAHADADSLLALLLDPLAMAPPSKTPKTVATASPLVRAVQPTPTGSGGGQGEGKQGADLNAAKYFTSKSGLRIRL